MSDNTPKKTSVATKLMIAAFFLLLAAVVQYLYYNWTDSASREVRMIDSGDGVSYSFDANARFYSYDARSYYFCTKDGMDYLSLDGKLKWRQPFSMTRPLLVSKCGTVAVGEEKTKTIYVFTPDGLLYEMASDDPILFFSVNQAGYLAVIAQVDNGYAIRVYNKKNTASPLYTNYMPSDNIYPVAVDVSEDGKYAAIASVDLSSVRVTSRVTFCYLNSAEAGSLEDGEFAVERYDDQLAYSVKFMSGNRVLVFTDTQAACYQPGEGNTLLENWSIALHNKLDYLCFYGDQRFAFATGDKHLNDEQAEDPGVVQIYGLSGEKSGEFRLGRRATYLSMGCDAVIVGADRGYYALNSHGGRLWEYTTLQDTRQLIFLDNTDTVLLATASQATVLRRTRQKVTAPPVGELEWPSIETGKDAEVDE